METIKGILGYLIFGLIILGLVYGSNIYNFVTKGKFTDPNDTQLTRNYEKETFSLISIKYEIEEKILINILEEYNAYVFDENYEEVVKSEEKKILTARECIKLLSEKYNIPEKTIAEILIYLRIIERAEASHYEEYEEEEYDYQ